MFVYYFFKNSKPRSLSPGAGTVVFVQLFLLSLLVPGRAVPTVCVPDCPCRHAGQPVCRARGTEPQQPPDSTSPERAGSSPSPTPKACGPEAHRDRTDSLPVRSCPEGTAFGGLNLSGRGSPLVVAVGLHSHPPQPGLLSNGQLSLGWGLRAHCEVPLPPPQASTTRWQEHPPLAAVTAKNVSRGCRMPMQTTVP